MVSARRSVLLCALVLASGGAAAEDESDSGHAVRFRNNFAVPVSLFWVNMNTGAEVAQYEGLSPHTETTFNTFDGHSFVARDAETFKKLWYFTADGRATVEIGRDVSAGGTFVAMPDSASANTCRPSEVLKGEDKSFDQPNPRAYALFKEHMAIPYAERGAIDGVWNVDSPASVAVLDDIVAGEGEGLVALPTLVAFYRPGACQKKMEAAGYAARWMGPMFMTVARVNMDADQELSSRFGITVCPTIGLWQRGDKFDARPPLPYFDGWKAARGAWEALSDFVWEGLFCTLIFQNDYDRATVWHTTDRNDQEVFVAKVGPGESYTHRARASNEFGVRDARTNDLLRARWRPMGNATLRIEKPEREGAMIDDDCTHDSPVCVIKGEVLSKAGSDESHFFRRHLNRLQPSVVPKFTPEGFRVRDLPAGIYKRLTDWFAKAKARENLEVIPGYFVNHKAAKVWHVDMPGDIRNCLFHGLRPLFESWAGVPLEGTACYGIRTYTNGSTLAPHVDTVETHAVSAIINVEQVGMRKPWPLEIKDHEGVFRTVSIKPGQMIFYESARLSHGRPSQLDGDRFSSLFIHYRPKEGWNFGVPKRI